MADPQSLKSLVEPGAERVVIAGVSADVWRFRHRLDSYFDGSGNYVQPSAFITGVTADPTLRPGLTS
jgi:hypothetical protein